MPRKTDANEPADWLWISEQDLQGIRVVLEREVSFHDDPDWPALRHQITDVTTLLETVKARVQPPAKN